MNLIELKKLEDEKKQEKLNELLILKRNDAGYYYNLGLIYLSLKSYDAAISNFKKSIDLEFDYVNSYYYLAVSYLRGLSPKNVNDTIVIKLEELLNGAIMLEKNYKFYLLMAFINYDYYYKIGLMMFGGYEKYINESIKYGLNKDNINDFFIELECLNCEFQKIINLN